MWTFLQPWKVRHKYQIKSQSRFFNDYIVSNINEINVQIQNCINDLKEKWTKDSEADKI